MKVKLFCTHARTHARTHAALWARILLSLMWRFERWVAVQPGLAGVLLNANWLRQPWCVSLNIKPCPATMWHEENEQKDAEGVAKDNASDRSGLQADRTSQWRAGNRQSTNLHRTGKWREGSVYMEGTSMAGAKRRSKERELDQLHNGWRTSLLGLLVFTILKNCLI